MSTLFLKGLLVSTTTAGLLIPSIGYLLPPPTEDDQTFLADEVTVNTTISSADLSIDRRFLANVVQTTVDLEEISTFFIDRALAVGPVVAFVGLNTPLISIDRAYLADEVMILVQISGGFSEVFVDFEVISLKGELDSTRKLDGELETTRGLRGEM